MIRFENISFSRSRRTVLNNLNFTIGLEEKVAILGGSGEGKTTILKLILRLLQPDSGKILIDGEDITNLNETDLKDVRHKFSIVFQDGALFDSLNVKENVAFYLREYFNLSEEEIDRRVRQYLRIVSVEHAIDLMPEELSGGMIRRVAIARSLAAQNPKMFLFDEPTSDLDPVSASTIRQLIYSLTQDNRGFIMVTHEIDDALKTAERFLFLKEGNIKFDGTREQFLNPTDSELKQFLSEWTN
ncbi:ABC transporter, ATP-binding protein [Chitinispirillum alkaliphilum]|nr:ABC transporter, ATP-binding protein [Chitinispirillum alkaliphilum]